jgi:hypothetical protein
MERKIKLKGALKLFFKNKKAKRTGDLQAVTLSGEPKEGRQRHVIPFFDRSATQGGGPKKLRNPRGVSEVFTPYSRGIHALPSRGYRGIRLTTGNYQ